MWYTCPACLCTEVKYPRDTSGVALPRATLEFPAEGICPLHMSLSCQEHSAQLCPALKDAPSPKDGTKQFPFHSWEQIIKLCHGKTLVMFVITCDTSITWDHSQTWKLFRLRHPGVPSGLMCVQCASQDWKFGSDIFPVHFPLFTIALI